MSLADLPIENLALIQAFFAANIDYMDTRIINLCRAMRAKMTAHTWPTLFIDRLTFRNTAVIAAYKFSEVCIINDAAYGMLHALRPDLNVSKMYDENDERQDNDTYACYNKYPELTVSTPGKAAVTGADVIINSSCTYKLLIIPRYTKCTVKLVGTLPSHIELGGYRYYPYARCADPKQNAVRIYANDVSVYDGKIAGGYVSMTGSELFGGRVVSRALYGKFSMFTYAAVYRAALRSDICIDTHIYGLIEYLRGARDDLRVPITYDTEYAVDALREQLLKGI